MSEREEHSRKLLERMTTFNDAVYAIALTVLVLELKLPDNMPCNTVAEMWHCIREMSPKLLAFLLSVALVGGNWIGSVIVQRAQVAADVPYMIYLIIYLSLISLTPFTCNLIGSYPDNPMSYIVFGSITMCINVNAFFYLRHCRRRKLYHSGADPDVIAAMEKAPLFVSVIILVITVLAFCSTKLSFALFLLCSLLPFFFTRSLKINHKAD